MERSTSQILKDIGDKLIADGYSISSDEIMTLELCNRYIQIFDKFETIKNEPIKNLW